MRRRMNGLSSTSPTAHETRRLREGSTAPNGGFRLAGMLASRPLGEMLPRVGETIDRYRVVAELAHGGMAAIYVVRRSGIGGFDKLLALKVLLPHLRSD